MTARPCRLALALALAVATTLAVLGAGARGALAADFEKIEKDIDAERAKVAAIWMRLAEEMAALDLKDAAADAVARARAADHETKGVEELSRRIEGLPGAGTMDDAAAKRVDKARKDAAKGYDRMAAVLDRERQDLRWNEFLVTALGLDPSKARVKAMAELAKREPVLLRGPAHRLSALVSLPEAWKPGAEYPVLVAVEGEGTFFAASLGHFRDLRAKRPWILVCPQTLSSAEEVKFDRYPGYETALVNEWNGRRLDFDEEGLVALLDFLHAHFGAATEVAWAGTSKGGPIVHRMLLRHPGRVRAAALTCARFDPELAEGAAAVEGGGPPVLLLTAEKDPDGPAMRGKEGPGIEAQNDLAATTLAEKGFAKVTRRTVAGAAKSDFPAEVWAFLDAL